MIGVCEKRDVPRQNHALTMRDNLFFNVLLTIFALVDSRG